MPDDQVDEVLAKLPESHRLALDWFATRSGQVIPWPDPLPDGTHLVTKAKGIHKPRGWTHALSIRQTLDGPYADEEPVMEADGTWTYRYFQEQLDPDARDSQFTNRALLACMTDGVPVAVLRQTKRKPGVRYQVLGIGDVVGWDAGYFTIRGRPTERREQNGTTGTSPSRSRSRPVENLDPTSADETPFDPSNIQDARQQVLRAILARRGQRRFRDALIDAYGGRCAITGCDILAILEAAHITPYLGADTNHVTNGLLLRADLHTLFDTGLMSVDPDTTKVLVAPSVTDPVYRAMHGQPLRRAATAASVPSAKALQQHRDGCAW